MYTTIKTLWNRTKNKSEIARVTRHDLKNSCKGNKRYQEGSPNT